jgi:hypothetical protein
MIQYIANELYRWARIDTWNSYHALDQERFFKCLRNIFSKIGTNINGEGLTEALTIVIDDLRPNMYQEYIEKEITEYARAAFAAADYIRFNN